MDGSRRAMLTAGVVGAVGLTAAGCQTNKTGGKVTQPAGNTQDMINQQATLTIDAWNVVKDSVGQAYPDDLLHSSLELMQLREKLLRFNVQSKTGWVTVFAMNTPVAQFEVAGKVSSAQSSMTSTELVYKNPDSSGSTVAAPGDDLSFGPNEGGDSGVFFFLAGGGMIELGGLSWMYSDVPLNLPALAKQTMLAYDVNATPTSIAPKSTLFK